MGQEGSRAMAREVRGLLSDVPSYLSIPSEGLGRRARKPPNTFGFGKPHGVGTQKRVSAGETERE